MAIAEETAMAELRFRRFVSKVTSIYTPKGSELLGPLPWHARTAPTSTGRRNKFGIRCTSGAPTLRGTKAAKHLRKIAGCCVKKTTEENLENKILRGKCPSYYKLGDCRIHIHLEGIVD
jgi:hypothetical protein